jgi:hypothetical protein
LDVEAIEEIKDVLECGFRVLCPDHQVRFVGLVAAVLTFAVAFIFGF